MAEKTETEEATIVDLDSGEPLDFSWAAIPSKTAPAERIMFGVWLCHHRLTWPDVQLLAYYLQIPMPALPESEFYLPLGLHILKTVGKFYEAQQQSWIIEQLFTRNEQEQILCRIQKISRSRG